MSRPDQSSIITTVDDSYILENSTRFGNYAVLVSDVLNTRFHFSADLRSAFAATKAKIVFKTKAHYDSFAAGDLLYSESECTFLNHVGRSDDSIIYQTCQDFCRSILIGCDLSGREDVAIDFAKLVESASLYAAEDWSIFLRSYLMMLEKVELENIDLIILCGNLNFSLCMSRLLTHAGVKNVVLKPKIADDKIQGKVHSNINNLHRKVMGKHPLNCDIKTTADEISRAMATTDVACVVRITDTVYAQNISMLIESFPDLNFLVLDNFQVEGSRSVVESMAIGAKNYALSNIGKGWSCFTEKTCAYIAGQISASMSRFDNHIFVIGDREVHPSFFHYNANNLLRSTLHSLTYYRLFKRALRQTRPRLGLLLSPARRIESRVAVTAARELGVPTFDLQCGTITRSRRFWTPDVDHVLCNESESFRVYTDFMGVPAERVHIVGSPRLDKNVFPYRTSRAPLAGRPMKIFLALQPLKTETTAGMVQATVEACERLGDCELVIGFHPRESELNRREVLNILETARLPWRVHEEGGLASVAESDACVTFFSFLGVEAYALGCHVIGLNIGQEQWPFRLSTIGIAAEAHDASELGALLHSIRDGDWISRLRTGDPSDVLSRASLRDGKSAHRIGAILNASVPPARSAPNRTLWNRIAAIYRSRASGAASQNH